MGPEYNHMYTNKKEAEGVWGWTHGGEIHTEERPVNMEAEVGGRQPQANERQKPPEAARGKKRTLP